MISKILRTDLRAWHVKAFMWLWVVFYPLAEDLIKSGVVVWDEVVGQWLLIAPFLVLFILFDLLIVPRLLERKRIGLYVAITLSMLAIFVVFRYFQMGRHLGDVMGGPKSPVCVADDFGPAPDGHGTRPFDVGRCVAPRQRESRPVPEKRSRHDGRRPVVPYVMDGVIAFLMLSFDLSVALLFQMKKEREKMSQMENANLQNELRYLKAQLEPHFLMNMLNNIHSMIEVDPARAQEMVINFSKLMRYALYEGGGPMVPLSHEAAFIANYIAIMRQRFSNRKVDIRVAMPDFLPDRLLVPPMLYIVFIENAFKHGVSYRQESFVDVSLVVMSDGRVRFLCSNSVVPGRNLEATAGRGIGLQNVRKRLDLLFGDEYKLDISEDLASYSVSLEIPTTTDEKRPLHSS